MEVDLCVRGRLERTEDPLCNERVGDEFVAGGADRRRRRAVVQYVDGALQRL